VAQGLSYQVNYLIHFNSSVEKLVENRAEWHSNLHIKKGLWLFAPNWSSFVPGGSGDREERTGRIPSALVKGNGAEAEAC
jgi:hypothetical protein